MAAGSQSLILGAMSDCLDVTEAVEDQGERF